MSIPILSSNLFTYDAKSRWLVSELSTLEANQSLGDMMSTVPGEIRIKSERTGRIALFKKTHRRYDNNACVSAWRYLSEAVPGVEVHILND